MALNIVVIGANAAGLSAAMQAKRSNKNVNVTVFDKSEFISYGACLMPYYLCGDFSDHTKLIAKDVSYFEKNNVKVYTKSKVIEINTMKKYIIVEMDGSYKEFPYDRLVIATGANSAKLPVFSENYSNLFYFTILEHAISLKKYIAENRPLKAVVIGGGYIGMEIADSLAKLGINVSVIELGRILSNFDKDTLKYVYSAIEDSEKLDLLEGVSVKSINSVNNNISDVFLSDGKRIECDLVISAVGIRPDTELAQKAGIKVSERNAAIKVNKKGQTSIYNIYACGDCAEVFNSVKNDFDYIPLGTNANRFGKNIGENIVYGNSETKVNGANMLSFMDLQIGGVGITEEYANKNRLNIEVRSGEFYIKPGRAKENIMFIKFVVEKFSKRLLGAQLAGYSDIHGKVNNLSTMIYNKMKVTDIPDIDFGYHPKMSKVWDPIILLARKF